MTPAQEAAKRAMEQFVQDAGGNPADIVLEPGPEGSRLVAAYYWTDAEGRRAAIGWEHPQPEMAAIQRAELKL